MSRFATGLLRTEVAVLVPESTIKTCIPAARACTAAAFNAEIPKAGNIAGPMLASLDVLLRNHIDFELIFEEVLENAEVENGVIKAPNSRFSVLIIPQGLVLSKALTARLTMFIQAGGNVIFIGCRVDRTYGEALSEQERQILSGQPLLPFEAGETPEFRAELWNAVASRIELPYRLIGEGVDNVFTALRDCDGIPTLLLSNQGAMPVEFMLETTLPAPVQAISVDDGSRWAMNVSNIQLYPEQSVLLEFGRDMPFNNIPAAYQGFPRQDLLQLDDQWNYELTCPNIAVCRFEIGLVSGETKDFPEQVKCWIPVSRDGCHGLNFSPEEYPWSYLRGEFLINDASVLSDLALIVDSTDYDLVILNGQEISSSVPYTLWDHDNRKFEIEQAARLGINHLVVRIRTSMWASPERAVHVHDFIEPVVLHGRFAANLSGDNTVLSALPGKIKTGDLRQQGFPQYIGEVIYRHNFVWNDKLPEKARIFLPKVAVGSVEAELNGISPDIRLWQPYLFDCADILCAGNNELAIRVSSRLGMLLPRIYGGIKIPEMPFGILTNPTIVP